MGKRRGDGQVFQITGAREGLSEDIRGRQRRYAISMAIRTVCVILFILLWHVQIIVASAALVLGAVLPYVAVVVANAGRSNAPALPPAFVPGQTRNMLEAGPSAAREEHGRDGDAGGPPGDGPGGGDSAGSGSGGTAQGGAGSGGDAGSGPGGDSDRGDERHADGSA